MRWLQQNVLCFARTVAAIRETSPVRSAIQCASIEVRTREAADCKFCAEYFHGSNHGVRNVLKNGSSPTNPDMYPVDEGFVLRTTNAPTPAENIPMQMAIESFLEQNPEAYAEKTEQNANGFSLIFRFHR